jgi:polyribonucleotide nucleotidyltransferase
MVLVYAVNGEKGDACVEAIRQMTKDVELGEVFTGKVVKTTTFGAFVELSKGTDGLLHISNLVPGGRAETVEDVVNRGDQVKVRVVELNKERGRIGLRLADDPEIADKTVEELSKIGTGNGGRPSGGSRDRERGGRDRDRGGRGGRDRDRGPRDRDRGGSRERRD